MLLIDPDKGRIVIRTHSPVLGLWAANRLPDDHTKPDGEDGVWWNRTYPAGPEVRDEFELDFRARFGR